MTTGCKPYYSGELEVYNNPPFIKKTPKQDKPVAKDENGNPLNMDDVNFDDFNKDQTDEGKPKAKAKPAKPKSAKTKPRKAKTRPKTKKADTGKLPRCPNGTKRNKITGNCEPK